MTVNIEKFPVYYTKLPHYKDVACNLTYATPDAACFDICAALEQPVTLHPGERIKCPTGIKIAPENPFWCRINGRSGLAANHGIIPVGGIIDTDYRGEIMVALHNHSNEDITIESGERVAQMVIAPYIFAEYEEVSELEDTVRGEGGFGSTGTK